MAKPIIDVSENNGFLDWGLIKDQIDGAIIRCGYGGNRSSQDDQQYIRNVSECTRLKIPMGVYLFSYARSVAEAQDEADHVLRLVKGWNFALPIYYDLEYSAYVGDISASLYTQMATAFCEKIEAAGGFVGIYANLNFWQTKLSEVNAYTRWLAQWADTPTFDRSFDLWQYTSDGSINGSSARTDLSKWYGYFLTMAGTKNYFGDGSTPIPEPNIPALKYQVGDHVSFRALFMNSQATQPITNIAVTSGVITKIIPSAHNPYLINNGTGWVNDDVIETADASSPAETKYQVGDNVHFDALFTSSTSAEPITNIAVTSGTITKIIPSARNPYLINGSTGWVNDQVIVNQTGSSFQVGDQVRVKNGAKDINGQSLAPFVYQTTYQVMQVNGSRVVIGNGSAVTAALAADNLYHV